MPLQDTQIRNAKPKEKNQNLNDGLGLSLFITPKGAKCWRFRYTYAGKPKLISFGVYPDVSLSDARARRDDARKLFDPSPF